MLHRNNGGNIFRRLKLTYPPRPPGATMEPVLSSSADAFHIKSLPQGPHIQECLFEGHNDDGIALHGTYALVVDAMHTSAPTLTPMMSTGMMRAPSLDIQRQSNISDHSIESHFRLWVTSADFAVGDSLKLYDDHFLFSGWLTVDAIERASPAGSYAPPHNHSHSMPNKKLLPEPKAWYQVLNVTGMGIRRPIDVGFDYIVFNTNRSCSGFEIVNTTIRNHRARAMLIKASHGIIANNHIENSTLGGIVVTPELYWGEGDYVNNLTIMGNYIRSVCIGQQCYGGVAIGAKDPSAGFAGGPPYGHTDVRVLNNSLVNISQMNIWVSSTNRVEVSGNKIIEPYAYAPVATCCPPYPFPGGLVSWFTNSTHIIVGRNCIYDSTGLARNYTNFYMTDSVTASHIIDGGFQNCNSRSK